LVFLLAAALGLCFNSAFICAVLFAVNPIIVEQLIVIAGRSELMSVFFMLVSLIFFLKNGTTRLAASLAAFILALLSKENAVAVPFLAAASLFYLRRRPVEYLRVLPFFLIIPVYIYSRGLAIGMPALESGVLDFISGAVIKIPKIAALYAFNALFPVNLHSHRLQPDFGPESWIYTIFLVSALAFSIWKQNRLAVFLIVWHIVNLGPKMPLLVSGGLMIDHWAYLSGFAVFFAVGKYADRSFAPVYRAEPAGRIKARKTAVYAAVSVFAVFWTAEANINITGRGSDIKIYEHAVKYTTSTPLIYNLGREYFISGRFDKALECFTTASGRYPRNTMYLNGMALVLNRLGRKAEAVKILDEILSQGSCEGLTLYNRAEFYAQDGKIKQACAMLEQAVACSPDLEDAYCLLAKLRLDLSEKDKAEKILNALLEMNPRNAQGLSDMGVIKAMEKDYASAEKLWKQALSASPGFQPAVKNLEKLLKTVEGRR